MSTPDSALAAALAALITPVVRQAVAELAAELMAEGRPSSTPARLSYTEAEAAELLGVEPHVLREQRRLGRIEYTRGPGRRVLYTPAQLDAYLASRKHREAERDSGRLAVIG